MQLHLEVRVLGDVDVLPRRPWSAGWRQADAVGIITLDLLIDEVSMVLVLQVDAIVRNINRLRNRKTNLCGQK